MNDELLQASIALTEWLRSTGKTNKSRAGRVPAKLLEQLESAIAHAQQSAHPTLLTVRQKYVVCPQCLNDIYVDFPASQSG